MKAPGRRTREDAALICAVAESTFAGMGYRAIGRWLNVSRAACDLAISAESAVFDVSVDGTQGDAEAESLLRCGWCPGDLIERRGAK